MALNYKEKHWPLHHGSNLQDRSSKDPRMIGRITNHIMKNVHKTLIRFLHHSSIVISWSFHSNQIRYKLLGLTDGSGNSNIPVSQKQTLSPSPGLGQNSTPTALPIHLHMAKLIADYEPMMLVDEVPWLLCLTLILTGWISHLFLHSWAA